LCDLNQVPIVPSHRRKLHAALLYLRGIMRSDGLVPLIGDTDSSRVLPIAARAANDRAYLLAVGAGSGAIIGAAEFRDSLLKWPQLELPQEVLWLTGESGVQVQNQLPSSTEAASSQAFPDAGSYVLRHEDLFLLFNANGAHKRRPASHQHNDVLSIEISACGRAFVVDPGTYVYTADLHERQLFRSTAYHSTVQIDDEEQQTIREESPFAHGGEAIARVLFWETTTERDRVVAEHSGYQRLAEPVTHRRAITFDKSNRWWLIEDEFIGTGEHKIATRFHFDAGLEVTVADQHIVIARDQPSGACVFIRPLDLDQPAELEAQFTSKHYGSKDPSVSACWTNSAKAPCKLRWAIVPVYAGQNLDERISIVQS